METHQLAPGRWRVEGWDVTREPRAHRAHRWQATSTIRPGVTIRRPTLEASCEAIWAVRDGTFTPRSPRDTWPADVPIR